MNFKTYSNFDAVVIKLLSRLKAPITVQMVLEELDIHPDAPSLLAISDVLNQFDIENSAIRIEFDDLHKIPCPFIAHSASRGGEFFLVERIDAENIMVSNEHWSDHKLSHDEFKKKFSGIALTVEATSSSPSADLNKNKVQANLDSLRLPFIMGGVVILPLLVVLSHPSYFFLWQLPVFMLFATIGLITSILLLIQSIDNNNPLIERLCQRGSKTNCNAILTSNAAKVFTWLTWSEVGFFYFAGSWLMVFCNPGSVAILQLVAILNIISIPYTAYSIYYQWRIAKQWCVLCCTIQGLLWLEFIPSVTIITKPYILPNSGELVTAFACLAAPVVVWVFLKPFLLQAQQINPLKAQLRKFKYDTGLFERLLKQGPHYALPDKAWSIVLGNTEANTVITMVSNPYCGPCSKTHHELDQWLNRLDDIQLRIVFTANNTESDQKTPITRHLMALNDQANKTIVKRALNDWYERKYKNYETWAKAYPIKLDETKFDKLEKQRSWCDMAEIKATPTLLVNGYHLPEIYRLRDIKYLLN